jgi:hypothetical protein
VEEGEELRHFDIREIQGFTLCKGRTPEVEINLDRSFVGACGLLDHFPCVFTSSDTRETCGEVL